MSTDRNPCNLALVGPNGAGKTSLLESMLFVSGAIPRKGKVADGTSVGDHAPEARARQMSTEPTCATVAFEGTRLTVIDCPGSVEFIHDTRAVLMGVDAAVVGGRDEGDSAFLELPATLAPVPECVIQFEDSRGTFKVHLKGYSATDIATVGRSLRGSD